ncbi:hypothetical protein [Aquidulcibacter sp.]|uniref:hypothetical protein n=1 Tax=Aquidulcibacter sp. TaxID=2052990 RepID=UPI0025B9525E|nr:hypothetical protein [Aquidulcibacter sp.]MCA3696515.1 hypothetical protein [Aquidulcibacter sp.]
MNHIVNFVQVSADGKLIPASMTVRDMLALGWEPSKVVALRWTHDGQQVDVEIPRGIHGVVVPGENFVAALCGADELNLDGEVTIFAPDGSMHGKIGGPIAVSGHIFHGTFGWFEPAMDPKANTFGAVFQTDQQTTVRCDIDASALALTNAIEVH